MNRMRLGRRQVVALGLAAVIVAAASWVTWRDRADSSSGDYGLVAQQVPADPALAALDTEPTVGSLAPNFLLATSDGSSIELADLRGKPVLVNFWASWCFSCITEMPALQELADRYGDDLVVLGVNAGEPPDRVIPFATENVRVTYPLVLDRDNSVTLAYGVPALPASVTIDAEGVITAIDYGVIFPDQMEERVAPLLNDDR